MSALLLDLPLEFIYRETVNRYLSLRPSKAEYTEFMQRIEKMEYMYVDNKPKLRTELAALCESIVTSPEDRTPVSTDALLDWDD